MAKKELQNKRYLNASMMGLYGIVVPSNKMKIKVRKVFEYVRAIRDLGKRREVSFEMR